MDAGAVVGEPYAPATDDATTPPFLWPAALSCADVPMDERRGSDASIKLEWRPMGPCWSNAIRLDAHALAQAERARRASSSLLIDFDLSSNGRV